MKKITLSLIVFFIAVFCRAQAVSGYLLSQSTEVYLPVNGTASAATGDDGTENGLQIGFPFTFGGTTYTTFSISTNGFIRLGNDIGANNFVNGFANAGTQAPTIAAFWDDHNRNIGSIQYNTSGSSPNRTLEVGWDQISIGNNGVAGTPTASFKLRIYEASGQIDFVYGATMNSSGNLTASIGLNDLTSFLSVTPGATATTSSTVSNNAIVTTTDIVGKKYTFTPAPVCSGTPVPGTAASTLASVCPNQEFTLSMPSLPNQYGYSFQWQSSTNGTDYSDIVNATNNELTFMQTVATYYKCAVICGGSPAVSAPVQVTMSAASSCFCIPAYATGKTDGDLISNVVITGTDLANNSGTDPVNPSYTYFTGLSNYTATLVAGINYEIQVTVGSFGQQNSAVWIDFNDDTIFSPDERVGYTDAEVDSFGTATYSILLGCNAQGGLHRMRIRDVYNTAGITIDPCATYGWGETEDYSVTVVASSACSPAVNLGVQYANAYNAMLQWSAGCGQTSWDVHLTLAGGGLPSGTPSNPNITSNPLLVSGLTPATSYDFYVRGHCDANGDSTWAGPFTFTTGPVPVGNDECETSYALTPGGDFEEHALTATNVGATKSIGPPAPTCAVFGFGGDVWFSIVVPASGSITVETQSAPGSPLIDTGMTLFSGTCGDLTTLGCSDDEGIDAFSKLSLTGLTAGSTIFARVWEYANDTFGEFRVSAYDASLGTASFDAQGFGYYPNPVKDKLNLTATTPISGVEVYNLLGQRVMTASGTDFSQIDLSPLSKGAYLVKVTSGGQHKTIKIMKD